MWIRKKEFNKVKIVRLHLVLICIYVLILMEKVTSQLFFRLSRQLVEIMPHTSSHFWLAMTID